MIPNQKWGTFAYNYFGTSNLGGCLFVLGSHIVLHSPANDLNQFKLGSLFNDIFKK